MANTFELRRTVASLKEERKDLVGKLRSVVEHAESENRDLNTEEKSSYEAMCGRLDEHDKAIDSHETRINRLEQVDPEQEGGESEAEAEEKSRSRSTTRRSNPMPLETRTTERGGREYRSTPEYRRAWQHWAITGEKREEVLGTNNQGGYLITPTQLADELIKQIDNLCFVRAKAKIRPVTNAQSLGVPQMTTRMAAADWTTEVQAVTDDTTVRFGRRDLTPNLLSKLAKVSIRLLEASPNVEQVITEELAYQFAVTQENAMLNGSGSGQPLGVFVASANGVPTSQDYTTAGAGVIAADDLIGMKYALKQPYLKSDKAMWVFHRTIVKTLRTLKDSYGQYLWQPGLQFGQPDMLLDVPLATSEYAPSTVSTGAYVGVLGNFGYYWIAEVQDVTIQRLVERYADLNEVGFIGRIFLDAAPVLGEAFSRLKIT